MNLFDLANKRERDPLLDIIAEIFKEMTADAGRLYKESVLAKYSETRIFKEVLSFMFDSNIVTGLDKSKINKNVKGDFIFDAPKDLSDVFLYLQKNNTGKDKDIKYIQTYISNNQNHKQMIIDITTKRLKLGIDAKTINKVFPGLIRTFEVMLAHSADEYIDRIIGNEFIITEKLDGHRAVAFVTEDSVELFSRQGIKYEGLLEIENELKQMPKGYVYDGELIADAVTEHSKELYSITTQTVRKDGVKTNVNFHIFEMVPIIDFNNKISKIPCIQRKQKLKEVLESKHFKMLKNVDMQYIGSDIKTVYKMLDEVTSQGKEGLMLNIANAAYECKRSFNLFKFKKFKEADLLVISIIEGDGKNRGKLGAVEVKFIYKDKHYICKCGSGFSDDERVDYFANPNKILGKICVVSYFEVTQNKDGTYGLRFPVWKGIIRADKNEISMN